jgi:hypothetical protein
MTTKKILGRFRRRPYRNIFVALLAVIIADALAPNLIGAFNVSDLMIAALIVAALVHTVRERSHVMVALALGLPAIIARVVAAVRPDSALQNNAVLFLSTVFFAYLIYNILRDVVGEDRPTSERLFGALCAYVFIGMLFTLLYARLEFQDPNLPAFTVSNDAIIESASSEAGLLPLFTYYSFVTLTTLGYGDITPVSEAARTLAWIEALIGQLYLAVMVGGAVGLYMSAGRRRGGGSPPGIDPP